MKNYIGPGNTVQFTAAADLVAGVPISLGTMVGIVANDVLTGEVGVALLEGEFLLAKTAGTAYGIGDLLDWDDSAAKLDKGLTPATDDIEDFCVAMEAAASGATTCKVKLVTGLAAQT